MTDRSDLVSCLSAWNKIDRALNREEDKWHAKCYRRLRVPILACDSGKIWKAVPSGFKPTCGDDASKSSRLLAVAAAAGGGDQCHGALKAREMTIDVAVKAARRPGTFGWGA